MTRCIICDWSPTQASMTFVSPSVPRSLNNKQICNLCDETIQSNLSSITKKDKEEEIEPEKIT